MVKGEILLIEDETAIAQNIIYALKKEGYKIFWAKQGHVGLKRLNNKILLILLDIGLPDMSGFDVCKEIRKKSMVPIIFITARKNDVDMVLGLELGGDDYIVKPFSPRAMVARVRALLRRTTTGSKTIVPEEKQCKGMPFGIDEERKQITFYHSKLELTRYEYLILKTLLEHPGRVYSRQQLMQQIWIEPESSLERTVDAHVKSMRKKMKKVSPRHEVILTHRGLGYSLKEDW